MSGPLRSDELLASILDTFEADLSLPDGGGIVPRSVADQRDDLDPRVTVAVELSETTRHNRRRAARRGTTQSIGSRARSSFRSNAAAHSAITNHD